MRRNANSTADDDDSGDDNSNDSDDDDSDTDSRQPKTKMTNADKLASGKYDSLRRPPLESPKG